MHASNGSPAAQPSTEARNGNMLSGIDAYNDNRRRALQSASRGDSTGLRALRRLDSTVAGRPNVASRLVASTPKNARGFSSALETGTVLSATSDAMIYSSSTWASLPTDWEPAAIHSYVLFLGQLASTKAQYKVIHRTDRSGSNEWIDAGENTSAPRQIYGLMECIGKWDATCPYVMQQDAEFKVFNLPTCGIDMAARGSHSVWFASGSLGLSMNVGGIIGMSLTVPHPDQKVGSADGETPATGTDCAPPPPPAPPAGGGGGGSANQVCLTTVFGEYDSDTYEILWWDQIDRCWWAEPRMSSIDPSKETSLSKSTSKKKATVTLLGMGALPNGVHTMVQQSDQGPSKVVVAVDTTRASEAEVDAALASASLFDHFSGGKGPNVAPRLLLKSSPTDRLRQTSYHDDLKSAQVKSFKGIGRGRAADVQVDVPDASFSR